MTKPDSDTSSSSSTMSDQQNQQVDKPKATGLEKVSMKIHGGMESAFGNLAKVVVNYPIVTMITVVVLTGALMQGIHLYDEELSSDKQFTPRDSRAVEEQEWVELPDHYGWSDRQVKIYFTGINMVSQEGLEFMYKYWNEGIKTVQGSKNGKIVTYETQCAVYKTVPGCRQPDSVLSLFGYDDGAASRIDRSKITTEEWRRLFPSGPDVDFYLSGVQRDENGVIVHADAARMVFELKHVEEKISGWGDDDPYSVEYEIKLAEYTEDVFQVGPVFAYAQTSGQEEKQGSDAIAGDIISLIAGYILTVTYTCFVLSRPRSKYSHSLLGLVSVLSIGMATISSYGLCWLMGIKFNNVTQVLILILLGIGVDDTFVIMDCWWESFAITDMKERMVAALRHAGPAISVTSMTDMVAFLAGSSTVFPALRDFCYYAALGITFDFMYQVTFFVAAAYLSSKRQEANRADFMCCIKVNEDSSMCPCCIDKEKAHDEGDRGRLANLSGRILPRLTIGSMIGKIAVLCLSAFFLSLGIWGCTQIKMDFDKEWFVPDDASLQDVYEVRDRYFNRDNVYANVYLGDWDYSSTVIQNRMTAIGDALNNNEWVVDNSFGSWMFDLKDWVRTNRPANYNEATNEIIPQSEFFNILKDFTNTYPKYEVDVLYAADGTVKTSRLSFLIVGKVGEDGRDAIDSMDSIRASLDALKESESEILFSWAFPYIYWEAYDKMIEEVTRNVLVAAGCVLVLVTLLVANIPMGVLVLFTVGLVDICMLGFMKIVGVAVNGVSVICIVVAIGLAVDYSVHISHAFLMVKATDTDEYSSRQLRAGFALSRMGPAVLNGAFSTFLAILPLSFAKSYVFTVFFRMFSVIIFFGIWFGVFLLPVVLSFIGPDAYTMSKHIDEYPTHNPLVITDVEPTNEINDEMQQQSSQA
eukprot:TRINITY_DN896_c3_g1_i1.p1 TRINITY_DN896_c3_g1~~TRINITY_DN896_c3_g1_i1.p1  ORF type:complete len:922 (+),score=240.65 TRINITY_DN896_c3_g1_i1:117-2882(+)